ncbi:MAG: hypothetical protein K2W82_07430 [Candidatus Obscuribacterales bacterium]|nr:hypothetical protein [Candidatus Obscuribacterales bacterium]
MVSGVDLTVDNPTVRKGSALKDEPQFLPALENNPKNQQRNLSDNTVAFVLFTDVYEKTNESKSESKLPDRESLLALDSSNITKKSGLIEQINYPDGRVRTFIRDKEQITTVNTFYKDGTKDQLKWNSKTNSYDKTHWDANGRYSKQAGIQAKLYEGGSFWESTNGEWVERPDSSKATFNDQGNATAIKYPDGDRNDFVYFDDNVSLKEWRSGTLKEWRKTKDSNEWFTKSGDQVSGPRKRLYGVDGTRFYIETLDSKDSVRSWTTSNGNSIREINDKRIIQYNISKQAVKIYDQNISWSATDLDKNEWTASDGRKEHIAVEDLAYSYIDQQNNLHHFSSQGQETVKKASNPKGFIDYKEGSKRFQDTITTIAAELPQPVIDLLKHKGIKLVTAEKLTSVLPEFKGDRPRGWPVGKSWDDVDGIFVPVRKWVVASEKYTSDGIWRYSARPGGIVRHETGHGVNLAMGPGAGVIFSNGQPFIDAYNKDVQKFTAEDRSNLHYYLQANGPGRDETFADAFASLNGGAANYETDKMIKEKFPTVLELVKQELKQLK